MLIRKELYNMIGWRTKRHLVVIESDDWGSIRMPSKGTYDEFIRRGIRVDLDPYCKYDALATSTDLTNLFEVLSSVSDFKGNHPIITANTIVANPDFDKIKSSNYTEYFYKPFTNTLSESKNHSNAFELWNEGIKEKLFYPQFHGREHLNVEKWLKVLHEGPSVTRTAFELGTWGLTSLVDSSIKGYYMSAFNSGLTEDIAKYNTILNEGLSLFEQIFGYKSKSFIATTYEWSPKIEPCLVKNGVKYIQGAIIQKVPIDKDNKIKYQRRGFQGTRTKNGLVRLFRNCFFEPSTKENFDFVDDCLHRIDLAFKWGKAANICAHRLNFIGSIHPLNTDTNLPQFKKLLSEIVKRWPDVEFITSEQLGDIIVSENKSLLRL